MFDAATQPLQASFAFRSSWSTVFASRFRVITQVGCGGVDDELLDGRLLVTRDGTGATSRIMVGGLGGGSDLSGWAAYTPIDPVNQLAACWHADSGTASQAASAFAILQWGTSLSVMTAGSLMNALSPCCSGSA